MLLYILLIVMIFVSMYASFKVNANFNKYSEVEASSGLTGAEVAKIILNQNGIYDVQVQPISGSLTDHYDPRIKTIRLSEGVFSEKSISALSVAAHEVGHAIQHNEGYAFLKFRSALAPLVQFSSQFVFVLIFAGFLFQWMQLVDLGIIFYSFAVLFQIITLPVEFDASNRAMKHLVNYGIITEEEKKDTKKVLGAAAMTYLSAMLVSIIQLLRLISARRD